MAKRIDCAVSRLLELFYEQDHELYRRVDRGGAKAGTKAGSPTRKGYLQTSVDGRLYKNHRILWAMRNGAWPSKDLDHIDRNPLNNSAENLREVTNQENMRNKAAQSNNKLGIKGVCILPNGKYQADIGHNKKIYLGTYPTELVATQARADGELAHWGHISDDTAAALIRLQSQNNPDAYETSNGADGVKNVY